MDFERIIGGVTVCGRIEHADGLQQIQLVEPYSQLSASIPADTSSGHSNGAAASDVLKQLYDIASFVYDNQPLLRDILERALRRIESRSVELEVADAAEQTEIVRQELAQFFASAFPMPVPEECWAQLLTMIGSPLG